MDEIVHRLEGFDTDAKRMMTNYLNKCLTKFFETQVKDFKKSLRDQGIPESCIERESYLRMASFGLITMEEAKRRMDSY